MKTADRNTDMIDSYFTLLKNLSSDNKLELIARLSKSIKAVKKTKSDSWKSLFGALTIGKSADEFVDGLKKARHSAVNPLTCEKVFVEHQHLQQVQFTNTNTTFRLVFGFRIKEFGILKKKAWDFLPFRKKKS